MNPIASRRVAIWLLCGCFLIFCMVVIGGITRLTGSGLSITEWKPIMGTIPPLNDREWQDAFQKYQQIPQFQKINSQFQLEDFKSIFWWEFIHRLVGRLIGVVFLVPFIYFLLTRQLDRPFIRKALFLFLLGGLQGFLGWFMVKSGLTERTSVSHIRLAIHLITAFVTFGFTLWFALELIYPGKPGIQQRGYTKINSQIILASIVLQIFYGALVAGLHAGKMYNTFPLMDGQVVPSGLADLYPAWTNIFNNPVMVQFIHRVFAWALLILITVFYRRCRRLALSRIQQRSLHLLLVAVALQFILGVCTLLLQVPVALASVHQVGAFFLFTSSLLVLYHLKNETSHDQRVAS